MADSRFNQVPGYPGGPPMGPQGGGMQPHFIQATRPMNPMMQQQMMMPFAMQGMRMAPPNTPPPPYSAHLSNPGIVNLNQRPRTTLSKSRGPPKSEKERFFEEQRQKLRHFGKPGAAVVDTDSLIGAMFKPDPKPAQKGAKAQNRAGNMTAVDDDDGFGDFLQGPSAEAKPPEPQTQEDTGHAASPEPATLTVEERKDLTSMMMECSDLTAPQKAKGFHKPSLNEVHRPGHEGRRKSSFHESDHSRSWKQAADLDGLFQIPVQAPVVPVQVATAYSGQAPVAQGPIPGQQTVAAGIPPGAVPMMRPTGPPPAYSEALNHPSSPIMAVPTTAGFNPELNGVRQEMPAAFTYSATQGMVPQGMAPQHVVPQQVPASPLRFPEWCSAEESQLPPLFKQVLDASLVEGQICTDRLYPILLLSGLQREKLAQIWSVCNTASPGQLVKTELWLVLALIAVAQNNIDTTKLDILTRFPVPPVPVLVTPQNGSASAVSSSFQNGVARTPSSSPAPAQSPSPVVPPMPASPSLQQTFTAQPQPQPQPQTPYQVATSPSLSLSSAAMSVTSADDDFSDFQAGPSPSNQAAQVAGKIPPDESYGEFIGGGGSGGNHVVAVCGSGGGGSMRDSAFQTCAPLPSRSMGNGAPGGHRHLPPEPPCHRQHPHPHPHSHYHQPQQPHPPNYPAAPAYQPPPDPHYHRQQQEQQPHAQHQHHRQQQQHLSDGDGSCCPCQHGNARLSHSPPPPPPPRPRPPPPSSQQQQQQQRSTLPPDCLSDSLPIPSILPVDDKYGNNVRSFFCSSDSSTGHTSPSFEDDDFTDGRDSLSQISTSEQSENDDIRNFESYVEEFNHKTKGTAASPLHCPFPSVQQGKQARSASLPLSENVIPVLPQPDQHGRHRAETDLNTNSPASGTMMTMSSVSRRLEMLPGNSQRGLSSAPKLPSPGGALSSEASSDDFADFKAAHLPTPPTTSLSISGVSSMSQSAYNSASGDDFADFKSVSIPSLSSQGQQQQQQEGPSTMSRDDRYGALRKFDDDLMTSSVFESSAGSSSLHSGMEVSAMSNADENEIDGDGDDDEWANFAEAPADGGDGSDMFSSAGTVQAPSLDVSVMSDSTSTQSQASNSSAKDDILKLFAAGAPPKVTAMTSSVLSEGSASMVHSDSGYSTKSSFFDTTPPSGGHPEPGERDPASLWSQSTTSETTTSGDGTSWANFGATQEDNSPKNIEAAGGGGGIGGQFVSNPTVTVSGHGGDSSEVGRNVSSLRDEKKAAAGGEEDWGDFNQISQSSSPSFPPENSSGSLVSSSGLEDGGNWASFTKIPEGDGDENGADAAAHMVTIKKQNLGTNEIMGLFKVRNDPATLSTYQLPAKPSPKMGPRPRKPSSGRNRSLSSDLDEDMVPPPMDSEGEDGDDEGYTFSRGYDLDDYMQKQTTVTTYSPFGGNNTSPYYSRAGKSLTPKVTGSNEDSGSVHSLELPSAKPYDSATNDSHSVSSSDMNNGQEPSNVSGTWKSVESLDLPSDSADTNDEVDKDDNSSETHSHQPIQPQELLASMPRLADKYNIGGEARGNDRYRHEWERCLTNCCQILTEANTLFNNISSSTICNEVLKASDGSDYVFCVIEIYRVGCRIMTSMSSNAISSSTLEQTLKQIDLVWNNLSAFLVGASLLPDPSSLVFKDAVLKSDAENRQQSPSACGVCLLDVDSNPDASSATPSVSLSSAAILSSLSKTESVSKGIISKLTFAGRQYHSTCANFWVNCVDQTLPSLDLPELL